MKNALKKKLSDRLLWYFGLMESSVKKVTCPSEEEWHYIEHLIDRFLSGFLSRLAAAHPTLTHNDLHLCCLLRLGLDRYHVACLMGISSSSVSTSKMRIKKKMCVLNPDVWLAEESLESYLFTF